MEEFRFECAAAEDAKEVFALYHSLIDAPYSTWSEEYPTRDDVAHDVENGWSIVMRDQEDRIVAAISLYMGQEPDEIDEMAPWYSDAKQWALASRLGVALDHQGKGLAGQLLAASMDIARKEGCDAVRFLVAKSNPIAQRAYRKFEFDICGECEMWGHSWLCYQKRL